MTPESPPSPGPPPSHGLSAHTTAWADRWFDPERALLRNPPGSFGGVPDLSVHLVPQSAWYALGLLQRGHDDDVRHAVDVLLALCDLQYHDPHTPWDGTFAQFAESPRPTAGAREWLDYDPNWRQFVSTTFLLVAADHGPAIGDEVAARLRGAAALACQGEVAAGRLDASYTNIALMQAWLAVEVGEHHADARMIDHGHELAIAIAERFDRHGAFDEYNSPTYYGIDLFALGLWRGRSSSGVLRREGARLEAALWRDLAPFVHPGMGNICGPYSRTYGMDMRSYVAAVALPMWAALGPAHVALPDHHRPEVPVDHGHDLVLGAPVAAVGAVVPDDAADLMRRWDGPRTVERQIGPDRIVTARLEDAVMLGAEAAGEGLPAVHQYAPATAHWRHPGGGVGWIRLMGGPAPVAGRVEERTIVVHLGDDPTAGTGGDDVVLWLSAADLEPSALGPRGGAVPGARITLDGSVRARDVLPFGDDWLVVLERPPAEAVLELSVEPDATGHRGVP